MQAIVPLTLESEKQIITKLCATDSIVNTDKGMRVFSCDHLVVIVYANKWMNLLPK